MKIDKKTDGIKTRPKDIGCNVDIQIQSHGDVNIYNCTAPAPSSEPCLTPEPEDCGSRPIAPGQCLPLSIGSKPKQSQRTKLDRLLNENRVPSVMAASFFHESRRFLAGFSPANTFEQSAFNLLQSLSPNLKNVLSCAVTSYDAIPSADRVRLFDPTLPNDPNIAIDTNTLAEAFGRELVQRVGVSVFGSPTAFDEERPGQNRFFEPPPEFFETQLRICTINDLRTLGLQTSA